MHVPLQSMLWREGALSVAPYNSTHDEACTTVVSWLNLQYTREARSLPPRCPAQPITFPFIDSSYGIVTFVLLLRASVPDRKHPEHNASMDNKAW